MSIRTLELIRNRRSIRKYSRREVPRDIIARILEAARWAPSAHNAQPWRFIIVTERHLKSELARAMADEWVRDMERDGVPPGIRESLAAASVERLESAPVLIVCCITMEGMSRYPDRRRQECERIMAAQSLAAAIQNMLLSAYSEGLGACWLCAPLFCQDVVREVLGIPGDVEPQALVTMGYPAERPKPPGRKPILVYMNGWGGVFDHGFGGGSRRC
ncbi:MAG: nitroreductase [Candidatus Bathyarchaeota archaeon B63]|nr:MAG: nitroreductase [Candidatus Bathyarchaeota archaeon B63]